MRHGSGRANRRRHEPSLMRWFMARQGGGTDPRRDEEYTDWAAVAAFADGREGHTPPYPSSASTA